MTDFTVPSLSAIREEWLELYRFRNPGASTADNTLAALHADLAKTTVAPLFYLAQKLATRVSRKGRTGQDLDDEARELGTERRPAEGASGFVAISASNAGGTIAAGEELTIGGRRYACLVGQLYKDGDPCAVVARDTGPETNQPPGAKGRWVTPPPGISPNVTVLEVARGEGLTGGHERESDEALRARLDYRAAHPPASGNDAEYQELVLKTPGLAVEAAFTYPCFDGPGTTCVAFTVPPPSLGGSRLPSAAQLARVAARLQGAMPHNDAAVVALLLAEAVVLELRVAWAAHGWVDAAPWPAHAPSPVLIAFGSTPTPTAFRLTNCPSRPPPGTTLGFFDGAARVWRRKKVLSATPVGATDLDVVVDTAFNASDATFTPPPGAYASPWANGLEFLVAPVLRGLGKLGPGEQFDDFWDPGLRQRRSPAPSEAWPCTLTNRFVEPLFDLAAVGDVALVGPDLPAMPPAGAPGVTAYVFTLHDLAVFPQ